MDLKELADRLRRGERRALARAITIIETGGREAEELLRILTPVKPKLVIGVTGPPGSGKSTLIGVLAKEFASRGRRVGVVAIDPSSRLTGGAVLGDRIRMMDAGTLENIYIRSLASRGGGSVSNAADKVINAMASAGIEIVFLETVGSGQQDLEILAAADLILLVLTSGAGDEIQGLKAGLTEVSDIIVVNKADRPGAESLLMGLRIAFQDKADRILKISALRGEGVRKLVELIEDYERRGMVRDKRILKEVLVEKTLTDLRRIVEEEAERLLAHTSPRDINYAVKEIIKQALKRIVRHEAQEG